jgi:hypothetical protein
MTFGGDLDLDFDLVGDRGGEKAIMDVGLGFGLLHGMRTVLARGVTEPTPLRFVRLGECRPIRSLGMSNDMRPSALLLSSSTASRSVGAGERCLGVAGAGGEALFVFIIFSNRARRSDTGFCNILSAHSFSYTIYHATHYGRAIRVILFFVLHDVVDSLVNRHQEVSYSFSSAVQDLFPLGADCGSK